MRTWTWTLLSGVGLLAAGPISNAFAADQNGTNQDSSGWRARVDQARSTVGGAAQSAGNGMERAGAATKNAADKAAGATGSAASSAGNAASSAGNAVGNKAEQTGNAAEQEGQRSGRAADDASLATDVKANLSAQVPGASHVDVDAKNGVVTLTGSVASQAERQQAASAARQTDGVKSVKDNLKVNANGM